LLADGKPLFCEVFLKYSSFFHPAWQLTNISIWVIFVMCAGVLSMAVFVFFWTFRVDLTSFPSLC
jgi:hypothetical protein